MKLAFPLILATLFCLAGCDNHSHDYRNDDRPGIVYESRPKQPVRTPWGLMSAEDYAELQRLKNRPRTERRGNTPNAESGTYQPGGETTMGGGGGGIATPVLGAKR